MANALYSAYKMVSLGDTDGGPAHGAVNWESNTIKAVLIDHGDVTPLPQTHQDLDDIDAAPVATATLGTKTVALSSGTATVDAADTVFSTVTGDSAESINIYKDSGVASTSVLIVYFDTATGLPVTPNGGDITVAWNASGIFTW